MSDGTKHISLPALHQFQQKMIDNRRRFNVASCGRRTGKTVLGIDIVAQFVVPGWKVGWFASKFDYLEDAWLDINEALSPIIKTSRMTPSRIITFITGGRLYGFSLNTTGAGRSKGMKAAIVDEAGEAKNLEGQWEQQIMPALADFHGEGWIFGTPKGRNGFYKLYQKGLSGDKDWRSWQFPSIVNPMPTIQEAYEYAREHSSDRTFRQEWNAEFLADAGGVFRNVRECSLGEVGEPIAGHKYVAGVDWGRTGDFTVISVWDVAEQRQVFVDRYNQIEFSLQRQRIKSLCNIWNLSMLLCESNSIGYPNIEMLQRDNLPVCGFTTTNASKAKLVDEFALALENGSIELLENEQQIDELESFESTRTETGLYKYGAPDGQHDDMVIANLIAYRIVKQLDWSRVYRSVEHEDSAIMTPQRYAMLKQRLMDGSYTSHVR